VVVTSDIRLKRHRRGTAYMSISMKGNQLGRH